jgi:hypothetical protein
LKVNLQLSIENQILKVDKSRKVSIGDTLKGYCFVIVLGEEGISNLLIGFLVLRFLLLIPKVYK